MAFLTNRAPLAAVLAAGLVLTMAGCNRDQATPGGEASGASSGPAQRACIVLPDAESSNRWRTVTVRQLEKAFQEQGVATGHPERAERHQQVRQASPSSSSPRAVGSCSSST